MARKTVEQFDRLDQNITVGSTVVTRFYSNISIGVVVKLTPKSVHVKLHEYKKHRWNSETQTETVGPHILRRHPNDTVVINSDLAVMYAIKHS